MHRHAKKQKIRCSITTVNPDRSVSKVPLNYFTKGSLTVDVVGTSSSDEPGPSDAHMQIPAEHVSSTVTTPVEEVCHISRKESEAKAWQGIRELLHNSYLESLVPSSKSCETCNCELEEPVVCFTCTCMSVLCLQCAKSTHKDKLQFHNLVHFKDGIRVKVEFVKDLHLPRHDCQHKYVKAMDIFDSNGVLHSCQVTFCRCYSEAEALVKCGFWPASPKEPLCALSMDMMAWMKSYMLETNSSMKSICQALKWHHRMSEDTVQY